MSLEFEVLERILRFLNEYGIPSIWQWCKLKDMIPLYVNIVYSSANDSNRTKKHNMDCKMTVQ